MKKLVFAACAASLALVSVSDVAVAAKAKRKMARMTSSEQPFPGAQRSGAFGGASREGTNEVETIYPNNTQVKAKYQMSNMKVDRVEPILGNSPMSGTPAAAKKR